jgi:hypothetical protein
MEKPVILLTGNNPDGIDSAAVLLRYRYPNAEIVVKSLHDHENNVTEYLASLQKEQQADRLAMVLLWDGAFPKEAWQHYFKGTEAAVRNHRAKRRQFYDQLDISATGADPVATNHRLEEVLGNIEKGAQEEDRRDAELIAHLQERADRHIPSDSGPELLTMMRKKGSPFQKTPVCVFGSYEDRYGSFADNDYTHVDGGISVKQAMMRLQQKVMNAGGTMQLPPIRESRTQI